MIQKCRSIVYAIVTYTSGVLALTIFVVPMTLDQRGTIEYEHMSTKYQKRA